MLDREPHLAMASVPMQSWSRIYDGKEALENGTVFPELNKPFFVTAESDRTEKKKECAKAQQAREDKLFEIQKISFVLDDVRLYMDTHPNDMDGLVLLKAMVKKRKELLKEYALQFYPLTMDCMADIYERIPDSGCDCWQNGPCPWEGACV